MRSLDCFTQRSFAEMMVKANSHTGFMVTRQNINSHGMTVDISCSKPDMQVSVQTKLHHYPYISALDEFREKA
jgi:hypothetical protein